MQDSRPLERKPTVSLDKLMEAVAFGSKDKDVLSSLAAKLARLDRRLTPEHREELSRVAGGRALTTVVSDIVRALDPDVQVDHARQQCGADAPTPEQVQDAAKSLLADAVSTIVTNSAWRNRVIAVKRSYEQVIDKLPVPPLDEQTGIADRAERLLIFADRLEAIVTITIAKAERLRQSTLKRAFEGRLVPQDPNDEPAEILLARARSNGR